MHIVDYMEEHGHEQLAVWTDPSVGLRAFIAIHDTTLGPSLGGVRIWPHPTEAQAILDVLRLSKAMTYKSAVAGLPLGGGKGLIMIAPGARKSEAMLRSYGRFVESLGGRYVTTEDVGATPQDLDWVSRETKHVVGLPKDKGGSGNPATVTGYGLFQAMRATSKFVWGTDSLQGRTIALQGFGNVAHALSLHLIREGASLLVTDISEAKRTIAASLRGVRVLDDPNTIYDADCDIFAPCALGGVLNSETIPRLRCEIVCGGANNQLAEIDDDEQLAKRGIIFSPDYVANAGGVINVYYEFIGQYDEKPAMAKASEIYTNMEQVLNIANQQRITTAKAADQLAKERIESGRRITENQ